jgi:hypothetical protein
MVTLRSRASRKASTLLSARLALRVRELALELRERERREPDARDPLERERVDFRDELRRREPELPEPCAICLSSSAWLACRADYLTPGREMAAGTIMRTRR